MNEIPTYKAVIIITTSSVVILSLLFALAIPTTPNEAHDYANTNYNEYNYPLWFNQQRISLDISQDDFDAESEKTLMRYGNMITNPMQLADYTNEYVVKIADALTPMLNQYDELFQAHEVVRFVSMNISYRTDDAIYGTTEYWATPTETLYLRCGDCEDRSILACSIMLAMGLDAVLLDYSNHCAPGVIYENTVYKTEFDNFSTKNLIRDDEYPTVLTINDLNSNISKSIGTYLYGIRDILPIKP